MRWFQPYVRLMTHHHEFVVCDLLYSSLSIALASFLDPALTDHLFNNPPAAHQRRVFHARKHPPSPFLPFLHPSAPCPRHFPQVARTKARRVSVRRNPAPQRRGVTIRVYSTRTAASIAARRYAPVYRRQTNRQPYYIDCAEGGHVRAASGNTPHGERRRWEVFLNGRFSGAFIAP